jgi:hypothetical protein
MPPLRHKVGETYDVNKSEVVEWMTQQPIIRDYLFTTCANNGLIVFNKVTRTWQGRDFKEYQF